MGDYNPDWAIAFRDDTTKIKHVYLSARSRRVSTLATEVAPRGVLPRRTARYDDILAADLRRELVLWRAAKDGVSTPSGCLELAVAREPLPVNTQLPPSRFE